MPRNPCTGWQHGDPVTREDSFGRVIKIGTVAVRTAKDGHSYLMVRLQNINPDTNCYTWPENWVIGQGSKRGTCLECRQPFRTDEKECAGFCQPCDRRHAQEAAAASDTRSLGGSLRGARTPMKRAENLATADEIAALKDADAEASPF